MMLNLLKNIKNSYSCLYILNFLLINPPKKSSLSYLKSISSHLGISISDLTQNATNMCSSYKIEFREQEESIINELIKCCIDENTSYLMKAQHNWILYTGDLKLTNGYIIVF